MSGSDRSPDDDAGLAELLRAAGKRPQPSAAQLARWREHFEAELGARRRRRATRVAAAVGACAAAVVAAVLLLPAQMPPPAAVVADVVTAFGGTVVRAEGAAPRPLAAGDPIRAGQRIESGLYSGLAVTYRSADVRLDASTVVVFDADRLELVSGRVYVDTDGPGSGAAVRVQTPRGWFEHVGTQFLVAVSGDEVLGAVREGRIVLHRGDDQVLLTAAADRGRMVVISDGAIEESIVATSGALWAWTEASSAGLELSGRSADEVLRWVARERGQRLEYATPDAQRLAERAQLRGSGARLGPAQALEVIVAATRLRIGAPDGPALTVSLDSEADQDAD